MTMTQQQKAAFNKQYIYNQNLGWRDRYVHEGGLTHTVESEQGRNAYNRAFIYNPEVGWRERTASERTSKTLDVTLGPALKVIGDGTLKYGLILVGAAGIVWAASLVAGATYDGVQRMVT